MWAWHWALAPFAIHGLVMLWDEGFYHRRRGLGRWERWGHPADTLTVLLCYTLALTLPGDSGSLILYAAAAAFSTLFVTKDEWVHAGACSGGEHWLHASLFALHPVLLGLVGAHKWLGPRHAGDGHAFFHAFLLGQTAVTAAFLAWQTLYWNGPWKKPLPLPLRAD